VLEHPQQAKDAGPDDVRLDRFATILAAAGFVVVAPCFPAFLDLTLRESVLDDVERTHAYAESVAREIGAGPPAVFSISFGSLLALHLASRPHMKGRLGGVVLFGGYADLFPTVLFAVTGRATHGEITFETRRDPLHRERQQPRDGEAGNQKGEDRKAHAIFDR
jgi:hypothetical protein